MDPEQTNIKLDVDKWKIRVDERSKDRMKLQIKLSKDEAIAFKNFKPRKGTAFNYFTTIIVNNLKLLYTREKKYNKKIENYIERKKDDFM